MCQTTANWSICHIVRLRYREFPFSSWYHVRYSLPHYHHVDVVTRNRGNCLQTNERSDILSICKRNATDYVKLFGAHVSLFVFSTSSSWPFVRVRKPVVIRKNHIREVLHTVIYNSFDTRIRWSSYLCLNLMNVEGDEESTKERLWHLW